MFFVTESNSLCLEIFRFYTKFGKNLLRVSAVSNSVFKISPFSIILILSLMCDLPDFQNSLLSVTFFTFKFS